MTRKKIIAPILLGVCLAIGMYTLIIARAKRQSPKPPLTTQTVPFTPEITSCAKGVRVVKAEVTDAGTPDATVKVQIENVSDLGITAVSLEATNGRASYTVTLRSSFKEDKPIIVIKPHQTDNLIMGLVFGDVPLQIGGVFYEDGTEEGCTSSLKTLHELIEAAKSKKESSNETNPHSPRPNGP
jgi:hypothetical protein